MNVGDEPGFYREDWKGVHDIKRLTALEVGSLAEDSSWNEAEAGVSEYWVCQDLVNIQWYDVAGSEAERSHQSASSISKKQVVLETIQRAGRMTNVPYFKSDDKNENIHMTEN